VGGISTAEEGVGGMQPQIGGHPGTMIGEFEFDQHWTAAVQKGRKEEKEVKRDVNNGVQSNTKSVAVRLMVNNNN